MAIFTFEKDTGKKLFPAVPAATLPSLSASRMAALNDAAANAILTYLGARHFPVSGLAVTYDFATATASIKGLALDEATRENIVECCGDIEGVQQVDDRMLLATDAQEDEEFDGMEAGLYGAGMQEAARVGGRPVAGDMGRV